jgi:hypothetical protein
VSCALSRARNAEVRDLQHPVIAHEQIGRLDVAMHEARVVCMLQTGTRLCPEADDTGRRQGRRFRKRAAAHTLHHDEWPPIGVTGVVHPHDVRVRESAGETRLTQEAGEELVFRSEMLREQLDRDETVEFGVMSEINGRHPAAPELAFDAVPAGSEGDGQSSPSFLFLPCPLSRCLPRSCFSSSGCAVGGGVQVTRDARSLTALWKSS